MCFWMDGASRRRGVGTPVRLALYPRECQRLNVGVASEPWRRSGSRTSTLPAGARRQHVRLDRRPRRGVRGARRVRRRGRQLRRHRRLLRAARASCGASETIIGEWFAARGRRDDVVLATKVGSLPRRPGLSARQHRRRRRRVAAPPADRPHRPLLGAQGRPRHAAGGDARRVRRARARGQGAGDRGVQLLAPSGWRSALAISRAGGPGRLRRAAAALQPHGAGRVRGAAAAGARRARPVLRAVLRAGPGLPHREVPAGRRGRQPARARARRPTSTSAGSPCSPCSTTWPRRTACRSAAVALAWLAAQPTVVGADRQRAVDDQLADLLPTLSLTLTDAEVEALSAASRP